MRRWTIRLALAAVAATAALAAPSTAGATSYIECMNNAISHRDALLADGWSYTEAQMHYHEHTRGCYSWYYLGGPHIVPWGSPWPIEWYI